MNLVAVLIPCYNEAIAIASVIQQFKTALPQATIYVYDNNSTDQTSAIARSQGAIVRCEYDKGKGNVVRRMFSDVEADIYVLVDGDDTYDATQSPLLIQKLIDDNLDMVIGARHDISTNVKYSVYRVGHRFGNRLFSALIGWLFGKKFTDVFSGYRVFSRRFVKSFPAESNGFDIETELSIHCLESRLPTAEVPTTYSARPEGSVSKLHSYKDGFKIL